MGSPPGSPGGHFGEKYHTSSDHKSRFRAKHLTQPQQNLRIIAPSQRIASSRCALEHVGSHPAHVDQPEGASVACSQVYKTVVAGIPVLPTPLVVVGRRKKESSEPLPPYLAGGWEPSEASRGYRGRAHRGIPTVPSTGFSGGGRPERRLRPPQLSTRRARIRTRPARI